MFKVFDEDKKGYLSYHEFIKAMGIVQIRTASKNERKDRFENIYHVFDLNGDGKISVSELKNVFNAIVVKDDDIEADTTEVVKTLFAKYDADNSGLLDLNEFITFMGDMF